MKINDPIIFLDMDGVLNMMSTSYSSFSYKTSISGKNVNDPIEKHLMNRLEFILDRTPNTKIVISSSWKFESVIKEMTKMNFKYLTRIIDSTPRCYEGRGNQIVGWMIENDYNANNNYIVLEDEIGDVKGIIPDSNIVEVNMDEGLSHNNVVESVLKLNGLKQSHMLIMSKNYIPDRNTIIKLTKETYDYFISKGFDAQVLVSELEDGTVDYDKLLNNWDNFYVDVKRLNIVLLKE